MPAVAVRQGRRVLFILNRYNGYLDCVQRLERVPVTLEFDMWEGDFRTIGVEIKFFYTNGTDNGEGKPLCTCTNLIKKSYVNMIIYITCWYITC